MNAEQMRTKKVSELREHLAGLLQEQFNLRMQKASGQLTKTNELRRVRKEIARIRTVLNENTKEGSAA